MLTRTRIAALVSCLPAVAAALTPAQKARRTPVVDVFERTRDAVVNITATQTVECATSPFERFFDLPMPGGRQRYTQTSLGSGVVIHTSGYILTNAHVVAPGASLKVIFADKSEHEAESIARDDTHDVAVLRILDKGTYPAIRMGRSNDLMIGETVIAIGNPLGYEHTLTTGVVSAVERKLPISEDRQLDHLIQTDASINRGNSGGPLLNILGELIGVNTAIRTDAQNIGFAIPIDIIRKLLPDILSLEQRRRLLVGLRLGWREVVNVVEATGPAARANIEPGDELVSVDGHRITQDIDFYIYTLDASKDQPLRVELRRDGKLYSAIIKPEPIPIPDGAALLLKKFGLTVTPLTASQARQLDVKGGLIITDVEAGSPAAEAGFQRNLIVVQIGSAFPTSLEDVGLLLEKVRRGEKVRFRLYAVYREYIQVMEGEMVSR